MLLRWAPQFDILAHEKTRLFITHGGLKRHRITDKNVESGANEACFSIKEAVCAERPMTFLPLFAEQSRNTKIAVKLKLATFLDKYTISKEKVLKAVRKVRC